MKCKKNDELNDKIRNNKLQIHVDICLGTGMRTKSGTQ